jgi:hypothetical protein
MQKDTGMLEERPTLCRELPAKFCFESYGVKFRIQSELPELLTNAEQVVRKALLDRIRIFDTDSVQDMHVFTLGKGAHGRYFLIENCGKRAYRDSEAILLKFFNTLLRLKVAEFATDRVFIHAGVVAWRGQAIVIPGRSYDGKTTLVAALVKAGAVYMSDEYAVLDSNGFVHPFPRDLSVRYFDGVLCQKEVDVSSFGGISGTNMVPLGLLLLTKYKKRARWKPEHLTIGQGTLETVPHTIPIRSNPRFSLMVLKTSLRHAIIARSLRGDASGCARKILAFFDDHIDIMNAA